MLAKQIGFAKHIPSGEEDERTIQQMKDIAVNLIKLGEFMVKRIKRKINKKIMIIHK